ncbi:MAG: hypothetical protein IH899_04085 [Planctomycetes bacterium]|nr:hypothetical protein [Planctomycetota bacterium]
MAISYAAGMASLLYRTGDLFKGFGAYAKGVTEHLRERIEQKAISAGRPSIYLDSPKIDKDAQARRIAEEDGITRGLVCVLRCKEPCTSFDIHRNAQAKRLELVARRRVCLHYYAYMIDSMFGWLYVRRQSWLPLAVHIGINGREWLARRLDAAGIGYLRRENCFVDIDDFTRARKFSHQQLRTHWPKHLGRLVGQVFPAHEELLGEPVGDPRRISIL